jgi:Arc/MetJ family transcription regulator
MKHTSLYLDEALLDEAAEVLGTQGATQTVRNALEDVVRRNRLMSLASWDVGTSDAMLDPGHLRDHARVQAGA